MGDWRESWIVAALLGGFGLLADTEIAIIIGLRMFAACFVDLIGIGLGFFGVLDRSSKKTWPALGLALNIGILALRRPAGHLIGDEGPLLQRIRVCGSIANAARFDRSPSSVSS